MSTRTINQGFEAFHSNLTPGSYAAGKAASHKASITARLERDFDLKQMFYSGSSNNGTSIARHSDVDFFGSIPASKLKDNSAVSLREIKESLQGRFPLTEVYVDSPGVVLKFGSADWDKAEVIPAHKLRDAAGRGVYDIPDGNGGWMKSSPLTHNDYVTYHNNRLGGKLKKLIRLAKAWKYYRNVPISSFYLELRITKWMESQSSVEYSTDMNTIFRKLDECGLASMQDPKGISGFVKACSTDAKKADAISKLTRARTRAQSARDAEIKGDTANAFYWWNLLFNEKFPSYYY